MTSLRLNLLVIRSEEPARAIGFYELLRLRFQEEQPGKGPVHWAAEFDGLVIEFCRCRVQDINHLLLLTATASREASTVVSGNARVMGVLSTGRPVSRIPLRSLSGLGIYSPAGTSPNDVYFLLRSTRTSSLSFLANTLFIAKAGCDQIVIRRWT